MWGILGMLIGGAFAAGESISRSMEAEERYRTAKNEGQVTYHNDKNCK